VTPDEALAELTARADPARIAAMAAHHKVDRPYLGVDNPAINEITQAWRQALPADRRLDLARGLWATNVFEARVAAGKLLTQARIPDDDAVWATIRGFVPDFDSWAIADHMSKAGERRLVAQASRLDDVEDWVDSPHLWTRRAALVMTLPWTKQNHPRADERVARERILGWVARLAHDRDALIQKAVAWWLRDLSVHDPDRVRAFLAEHGAALRPFARIEASRRLG
jgi:3-methyladenine DNA glycosylase AlkD